MAERETAGQWRKTKITTVVIGGLLLLYAAVGFWLLPYLITSKLPEILQQELGRTGSIQEVKINPFLFKVDLKGFAIQRKHGKGRFIGFDEFFIDFELSSLFKRALTFDTIRLQGLSVEVDKMKNGHFNFDDLLRSGAEDKNKPEKESGDPFPVWISKLEILQGKVIYADQSRKSPFRIEIKPLELSVTDFHTHLDHGSPYRFSANLASGGQLDWEGDLNVSPLTSKGRIKLSGFKTGLVWKYIQDSVKFSIDDGAVDFDANYEIFQRDDEFQAIVSQGNIALNDLKISPKEQQKPVIDIAQLKLADISLDLLQQKVSIQSLSSKKADIHGWVRPDKQMNFVDLFAPVEPTSSAPAPSTAQPSSAPPPSSSVPAQAEAETPAAAPAAAAKAPTADSQWMITVKRLVFDEYRFLLEDRSLATTMSLDFTPIKVTIENFSSDLKGKLPFSIDTAINQTGHLKVAGDLGLNPVSTEVKLDLKLGLPDFQPYIDPVTEFGFEKGEAEVKGDVSFHLDENAKPQLSFKGLASINDFEGLDKIRKKKLLDWKTLRFEGVDFNLDPLSVVVKQVSADRAYTRFIINQDGSTNLSKVFSGGDGKANSGAASPAADAGDDSGPEPKIQVDTVSIRNASALFADRSLQPKFETGMEGLNGSIKGFSTAKNSRAKIDLKGTADKTAPVRISGQINVFSPDHYTDVGLDFNNLSLTSLSPYSGKFAGYKIKKGKMAIDLEYGIKQKKLVAENNIVIDQLTLGEQVDSPDAVSLPLSLAIALLKDADGVIKIDLPLRGSLDDPEFSIWGIVGDVLANLITKIVTSPFAALGSLIGDEEEMDSVAFAPGESGIGEEQKQKLEKLVAALTQRPALKLEIEGTAGAADAEVRFRARALKEQTSVPATPGDEDESVTSETETAAATTEAGLSDENFRRYLLQAYYKQVAGMKSLSLDAPMIQQQMNSAEVLQTARNKVFGKMLQQDNAFRDLARMRGQQIQKFLVAQGLKADRIFLLDVKLEMPDQPEAASSTAVQSKLILDAG